MVIVPDEMQKALKEIEHEKIHEAGKEEEEMDEK